MSVYKLIAFLMVVPLVFGSVAAQEDVPVVESFYSWILNYTGYDEETGEFRNPLVDGSYAEREELSPALIAEVEAMLPEIHHDPFLCAQDVPASAMFEQVGEGEVLVSLYFAWNPRAHTLVAEVNDEGQIDRINCMESVTARGTVESFYAAYREDRSVLDDSPLVTDTLKAQIRNTEQPLGGGDLVVCAQDRPDSVYVIDVMVAQDRAQMMVLPYFSGSGTGDSLTVDLVKGDRWQIDAIACEVLPETIATYLYNEFISTMRFDTVNGIERTPIIDWYPNPWAMHISETLLDELRDTYASDQPRHADPFLCAQNLPDWVEVAVRPDPSSQIVYLTASGLYPSGPDRFDSIDLAEIEMSTIADGTWQLNKITCSR